MNTHLAQTGRTAFAKLAYAPLGLLLLTAMMRSQPGVGGWSLVAVDLLALALVGLLGWVGADFFPATMVPVERRRRARPQPRGRLSHTAV